ncbi:hypothetical protein DV515_00017791 [Chloebia gouldiae]|uniref:Uncharacterized protein n=1 Tax=Chloebia gouldiae TaxID=44316 RepID=A0A3L8Q9M1_CHLGU|nr:hypothetical protein DV515_00017791 [Chloebia gouldiae]
MGYGIWDMGYGIWDTGTSSCRSCSTATPGNKSLGIVGFGIWDMGYGIWDMGYGIWDMGYGDEFLPLMFDRHPR